MNRTIEQALLSLLPTHNAALPQPLTDLASSLLAQSRHRASTLKAEEEIARPYACAHLACDRLKTTLNLPPIDPRPPIPPRIYKRLFNHLDKILPATASTPSRGTPGGGPLGSGRIRTPSSKLREQQQQQLLATSPLANKTRGTPGKDASLSQFRTASSASKSASKQPSLTDTPSKKQKRTPATTSSSSASTTDPLPRWLRPTLRYLTTHLDDTTNSDTAHFTTTPASKPTNSSKSRPKSSSIAPLVAAALESIIAPRGRPTPDAWVHAHLSAVLGALYLFVWRTVTWPGGEDVDRERYVRVRRAVGEGLSRARGEVVLSHPATSSRNADVDGDGDGDGGGEDEEGWEGWEEVGVKELDAAALRGNRHGWFDMEWVRGVEDFVERERVRMQQADGGEEAEEREATVGQIGRPDSMFQERYDYLGERKREAYAEWKQGMLKRIRELEAR